MCTTCASGVLYRQYVPGCTLCYNVYQCTSVRYVRGTLGIMLSHCCVSLLCITVVYHCWSNASWARKRLPHTIHIFWCLLYIIIIIIFITTYNGRIKTTTILCGVTSSSSPILKHTYDIVDTDEYSVLIGQPWSESHDTINDIIIINQHNDREIILNTHYVIQNC